MKIDFCIWVIAFFLQCENVITLKEIDCPDKMVITSYPRCVECCNPEDATTQPNCDLTSRSHRFPSLSSQNKQFCSCPEGWKWLDGSCVETCPNEKCKNDGLVYRKCFNHEWQLCPVHLKTQNNRSRNQDCYPGCFCPEGYYYIDGRCLQKPYCEIAPGKCGPGMEYSINANYCRRICSFVRNQNACLSLALTGCFCAQGTYYNDQIHCCVEESQC